MGKVKQSINVYIETIGGNWAHRTLASWTPEQIRKGVKRENEYDSDAGGAWIRTQVTMSDTMAILVATRRDGQLRAYKVTREGGGS